MGTQEEYDWKKWELRIQDLLKSCMDGKWENVVNMYDKYPRLQNARLTVSGETALHTAVSQRTYGIVNMLVKSIEQQERNWQRPSPLSIQKDRGNTPLHLAALNGNVDMCMCIARKHRALVGLRNMAGETPLFLAALRGKKDVFLYLHQICDPEKHYEYYRRGGDGQTVLHAAIIGEYFDLAYQIICEYEQMIYAVNDQGYSPLHLLASKPAVFRSGSDLDGLINRIIYHCLHVKKLKVPRFDNNFQDMCQFFSWELEHIEKYPENYRTCINFFRPLLKMLPNMIKRPVTYKENLPTSRKHMQTNDANYCEDPEERQGDTCQNQGKQSSNIEAEERPQLFPPNYDTCITIIKSTWTAMLAILELIVHLIVRLFGLRDERKKMQAKKEKNIWSVQIMELMLHKSSHHNYYSSYSGCDPGLMPDINPDMCEPKTEDLHSPMLEEELGLRVLTQTIERREAPMPLVVKNGITEEAFPMAIQERDSKGENTVLSADENRQMKQPINRRKTSILLAAKNGITEMVEQILVVFPMAILDRDSDGKNIVLLAVENRQTKLYEQLLRNIAFYESAFRAVDNNGNGALHLAATLGDYQSYPFDALQMQWEIKWYKYVRYSVPQDFFVSRNNENMTPVEVFKKSHEDLVKEGGKWLISTSKSCSVVATVVTTVAFASTATPPGGMKEGSSRPNLEHHPVFIVFAISSLIALSFSVTSVVSFLAILTPRHSLKDFEKQLPKKLLYALTYLFISLAAMLVCFCAGHFFLMRDNLEHNAFLVYGVACLPIAYFAIKQLPFYKELVLDTFLKAPRHKSLAHS